MTSAEVFIRALLEDMAEDTRRQFAQATNSNTLRKAWQWRFDNRLGRNRRVVVFVPHYWAWPYFLGRGPVAPLRARVLVWYRDHRQDPRFNPPPVRISQRRRLNLPRDEFNALVRSGELIVRPFSGPAGPQQGFLAAVQRQPARLRQIVELGIRLFITRLAPRQTVGERVARGRL